MKTFSVFQLGKNRASKLLSCGFAIGIYFSVLVMFASSLLFGQIWKSTELPDSLVIVQLPDGISLQGISDIIASFDEVKGVAGSRVLPEEELEKLLQPWFSAEVLAGLSPLPFLIEINAREIDDLNTMELKQVVSEVAGARLIGLPESRGVVSSYRFWLVVGLFILLFFFIIILVGGVVFLVTRTALLINSEMVEVLELLGASEIFVIDQFRIGMLKIAASGGLLGAALAVATLLFFLLGSKIFQLESHWIPDFQVFHAIIALVGASLGIALTWFLVPTVVSRKLVFLRKIL